MSEEQVSHVPYLTEQIKNVLKHREIWLQNLCLAHETIL